MPTFSTGDQVQDTAGIKGVVISVTGSRAWVMFPDNTTWVQMTDLLTCKQ